MPPDDARRATTSTTHDGNRSLGDQVIALLSRRGWPIHDVARGDADDLDVGRMTRITIGPMDITVFEHQRPPRAGGRSLNSIAVQSPAVLDPYSGTTSRKRAWIDVQEQVDLDLADRIGAAAAAQRAAGIKASELESDCELCRGRYDRQWLAAATVWPKLACPSCVFAQPGPARPEELAIWADLACVTEPAAPAMWSAVGVLLGLIGGTSLADRLDSGHPYGRELPGSPLAGQPWLWLPPPGTRPAALRDLDVGAALDAVELAIDRAHPGLRHVVATHLSSERARAVETLWPAIIAYAVCSLTQSEEMPHLRRPGPRLSFARLGDHARGLRVDPALADAAAVVLDGAVTKVIRALSSSGRADAGEEMHHPAWLVVDREQEGPVDRDSS